MRAVSTTASLALVLLLLPIPALAHHDGIPGPSPQSASNSLAPYREHRSEWPHGFRPLGFEIVSMHANGPPATMPALFTKLEKAIWN